MFLKQEIKKEKENHGEERERINRARTVRG